MKRLWIVLPVILLLGGSTAYAQLAWRWGVRGNDSGPLVSNHSDNVIDIATDPNGNVYTLSRVYSGGDINGLLIKGYDNVLHSNETIVLSSFRCDGQYRWHKIIGGTAGRNKAVAVKTDTAGGVYVAGNVLAYASHPYPLLFPDSLHIDTDSVSGSTNKTLFIVKYDTSGAYQWLRMPQPDTVDYITSLSHARSVDMDVSPAGEVYVYSILTPGSYEGGAFEIKEKHFYIIQYDKNGIFRKTLPVDISYTDGGNPDNVGGFINGTNAHFKRDHSNGHFYLSGTFEGYSGTMSVGDTELLYTGGYTQKLYLGCFDSVANAVWAKQATPADTGTFGSGSGTNSRVAIDESGNVYVAGYAMAGDSWYGHTFENPYDAIRRPTQVLMKLDANGNILWISTPAKDKSSNGMALHVAYSNGVVAISGIHGILSWGDFYLQQSEIPPGEGLDIFMGRFNAGTGKVLGLDTLNSYPGVTEYITAMTADRSGNFFTGGFFYEKLYAAADTLVGWYAEDWFLAKFGAVNCNCTVPSPGFTYAGIAANTLKLSYTGSASYTSIAWDFGDGSPVSVAADPVHLFAVPGAYNICVTVANDCGSSSYCDTVIVSGVGINEIPGFAAVSIYPNPAGRELVIAQAAEGTIMNVYNTNGRLVLRQALYGAKDRIDISNLPLGIYQLQLINKEGQLGNFRFVKQ